MFSLLSLTPTQQEASLIIIYNLWCHFQNRTNKENNAEWKDESYFRQDNSSSGINLFKAQHRMVKEEKKRISND